MVRDPGSDDPPYTQKPTLASGERRAQLPTALAATPSTPSPVNPTEAPLDEGGFAARYQMRALLGRGGMGEVRLCRDARIGREVAMKVVLPGSGSQDDSRARFLREARVQGQLEHPTVVPVYDLGVDPEGTAFFTMKRVRGLTLENILDGLRGGQPELAQRYTQRRLLSAMASVCLSVDFAHARGVVHRDLKPGNIMLGDFGEVYVLDWGLAKLLGDGEGAGDRALVAAAAAAAAAMGDGERTGGERAVQVPDSTRTVDGAILGTPGYMAPEQIGNRGVEPRADIYSLGAILFELLTLQPLHREWSPAALLRATRLGVDARPSVRAPEREVAPELEAICVKATAVDPIDRFASAREVQEAIERFLEGDRDLELRRSLAARHAAEAEALAERALAGAATTTDDARGAALREVGRALGLDPQNAVAMHTLVRLLVTPPEVVPADAQAELDREDDDRIRAAGRLGMYFYLSWFLFLPFAFVLGVQRWAPALLAMGAALATAALSFALSRSSRHRAALVPSMMIAATTALAAMSRSFGPLMLVPPVVAANTISFMLSSRRAERLRSLTIGCLAVALPLALEWLGVLDRSYRFEGGKMLIIPHMNGLPELPSMLFLTVSALGSIVLPATFVAQMRGALEKAEHRLYMHAWQLRRLVPEEALRGVRPSPPATPAPAAPGAARAS